ncbi:MAG TPA: adenylyl-sulfate kinase [Polyangia bacterium]|nr:adenylyl-sulfate kinase [Polyangia bacterium]
MNLPRLERLENEAIRLVREAVAGAERAALVRGAAVTDLALAHLARKAFHPAVPPWTVVESGAAPDGDGAGAPAVLLSAALTGGPAGPGVVDRAPDPWHLLNVRHRAGEVVRVCPLAGWTELDVWRYLSREGIAPPRDPSPDIAAQLRGQAGVEVRVVLCGGPGDGKSALARQMAGGAAARTPVRFQVAGREVVVTDAPAGEPGTRDLLSRAWAADLAVVVTAAGRGLTPESRRQIVLLSLLGVPRVVLAVNEMDLVSYDAGAFARVQSAFRALARDLDLAGDVAIPVSAVMGDNVGSRSPAMPWYAGPTLLEAIAQVDVAAADTCPARLAVQWVGGGEPGAALGTVLSGRLRRGEAIRLQPSGRTGHLARILTAAGEVAEAAAGCAVAVSVDGGVTPAPGDLIVSAAEPAEIADQFEATLIWLGEAPLLRSRGYVLQAGNRSVGASISRLKYKLNTETLDHGAAATLKRGEIGVGNLQLDRPIPFDAYAAARQTGSFLLVDRISGQTVGAGMLRFALRRSQNVHWQAVDVNRAARAAVKRQRACLLWYTGLSGAGKSTIANLVDKKLHSMSRHTYLLDGDNVRHGLNKDLGFTDADRVENIRRVAEVARLMVDAGLIVGTAFISPFRAERCMARALLGPGEFIEIFVDTPLSVAEERDPKGLYKKARRGDLKNFTGIDSPYERPENPEITIDTTRLSPEQAADTIIAYLDTRRLLDPE